jgi:hypothetical protein
MSYQFEPAQFDGREELLGEHRDLAAAPPQRLLTIAAALAVMALFAGGLWFAYHEGSRNGGGGRAVPLIRAEARPMMVRPAAPGGLKIPDRNMLIFDPGKQLVEHLLPPPEQPMARPTAASPAAAMVSGAPNSASPAAVTAPPAAPADDRRNASPARNPVTAEPPAGGHGPLSEHAAGVRLQLGSVRSAEAARLEWERMRHKNPDLLGALSASAVRADLGDKGVYYRIRTAPVGDLAAADRICKELRQRKLGCIIVR